MRKSILILSSIAVATAYCTPATADTIFLQGLTLDGVVIQGVANGSMSFQSSGGNVGTRDLARIQKIHVDGETALDSAEDSFAAGKFADAVDGYLKASRSSTHPWVKQYAVARLVEAANKSNRFDAAVTAYVTMLQLDPTSASRIRPSIPDGGSTYVDTAISQINEALSTQTLSDDQKVALLQFEVDLYNAKKDTKGSDQAATQLDELLAKDPNNPNAARANARRKLQLANQSLAAKKYQEVLTAIDASKALFTDPQQQADALYDVAQAREGLAGSTADQNTLKDVALCYMRVVADFKDTPGKPHVVDSLMKTAQIESQLNDADAAARLYQQITEQFPNDPAAATAKQQLAAVKTKT